MTAQTEPISVTIRDQSGAGKVAATITLDGIDSRITLRDLIRTRSASLSMPSPPPVASAGTNCWRWRWKTTASADGSRRVPLADGWLAIIEADARTARLGYEDPGGKPRKSLPPAVKQATADALAVIGKDLKAIRATIANERARLDACLASDRNWPASRWRELYLGHPVTGQLTRALIWTFSVPSGTGVITGIPVSAEALVTLEGAEIPVPRDDGAEVRLWHPVRATADEGLADDANITDPSITRQIDGH